MKKIYNQATLKYTAHSTSRNTFSELVPISILSPSVQMSQITTLSYRPCSPIIIYKLTLTNTGDTPCSHLILENLLPLGVYLIPCSLTLNGQTVYSATGSSLTVEHPLLLGETLLIEFEAAPFCQLPEQLESPITLTYFFKTGDSLRSLQTSSTSITLWTSIVSTTMLCKEISLPDYDAPLIKCSSITPHVSSTPTYCQRCHTLRIPYILTIDYINSYCEPMTFSYQGSIDLFCEEYDPLTMCADLILNGSPNICSCGYTLYIPLAATLTALSHSV